MKSRRPAIPANVFHRFPQSLQVYAMNILK
jgi:hypothetical protein